MTTQPETDQSTDDEQQEVIKVKVVEPDDEKECCVEEPKTKVEKDNKNTLLDKSPVNVSIRF